MELLCTDQSLQSGCSPKPKLHQTWCDYGTQNTRERGGNVTRMRSVNYMNIISKYDVFKTYLKTFGCVQKVITLTQNQESIRSKDTLDLSFGTHLNLPPLPEVKGGRPEVLRAVQAQGQHMIYKY